MNGSPLRAQRDKRAICLRNSNSSTETLESSAPLADIGSNRSVCRATSFRQSPLANRRASRELCVCRALLAPSACSCFGNRIPS